jgi:hypothetical protein
MATAMFYGVGKDFMFSRTVTQLPGPELIGKILEAYSTIKQVRYAPDKQNVMLLTLLDRVCGYPHVTNGPSPHQSQLPVVL